MNQLKAFADVVIKRADLQDDVMTIEGIASTPRTDRANDIVEPLGATFSLPIPLCIGHQWREVVGNVVAARKTPEGITFKAELPYVKEPGRVKDRIDEAMHSLKYRLMRFVSIGAKPKAGAVEFMKNGGVRYKAYELIELSLCTVPQNPDAMIHAIKSFNEAERALLSTSAVVSFSPSAVAAKSQGNEMDLKQSLSAAEKKRDDLAVAHKAALEAIVEKNETLESSEQEENNKRLEQIEKLDEHIEFLKRSEATLAKAKPVRPNPDEDGSNPAPYMPTTLNKEPGIAFAQAMRCLYKAGGVQYLAAEIAKHEYRDDRRVELMLKGNVVAGNTAAGWGAGFVNSQGGPFQEFLEFVKPLTIIGRLPGTTSVEFIKPTGVQTSTGNGYWVGEGKAKPLTALAATPVSIPHTKVANIIAVTEDWLRFSSPANDRRIRDSMATALQTRMDTDFVDPAKDVAALVSPASITFGAANQAATGTGDHADIIADLKYLLGTVSVNGVRRQPILLMDPNTALALSLMINAFGQRIFPGMTMQGGTFEAGIPVIVSDAVPSATSGGTVIMLNAPEILVADDGGFDVAISRDASLLMTDDASANMDSVTPTPAQVVSMFQTNSVAFRCERSIGWKRALSTAVAYITAVNWGAA